MSNVYVLEPPTTGKVVLVTSKGDIEIELWCKECPKACRNFIGLGMEGYYEGTTFHRVVPGFIVQGGDPSGTGQGGESIYGQPFKNEIHQRLRFSRRGLVGTANSGTEDNNSQFFITLDKADELTKKHTVFGKVVGDTIFNVMKIGEVALDNNERPEQPIVIHRMDIIINPFDDLQPRPEVLAAKKALKEADEARKRAKAQSKVKAIKKLSLVSFGEEAEADEAASKAMTGIKSSHAVVKNDPRLKDHIDPEDEDEGAVQQSAKRKSAAAKQAPVPMARKEESANFTPPLAEPMTEEELEFEREMREQVLKQKPGFVSASASEGASKVREKPQSTMTPEERRAAAEEEEARLRAELKAGRESKKAKLEQESAPESAASAFLSDQRARYASRGVLAKDKSAKARREEETMALLNKFKNKLSDTKQTLGGSGDEATHRPTAESEEQRAKAAIDPTALIEAEDDGGEDTWLVHAFSNEAYQRPKGIDPEKDPNKLDITDPRHPLNVRRRKELAGSGGGRHSKGEGRGE